jgi:transcriptional regulator with XRE-family HTH domain
MADAKVVGANLRFYREKARMTQEELGREACRIAGGTTTLSPREIRRYEQGGRYPEVWLRHLAAALGVTVSDLTRERPSDLPPPDLSDYLPAGDPLTPISPKRGRRLGAGAVRDLENRVHGLRRADDMIAGGDLMRPALRELRRAVRMYRESVFSEETGRGLLVQIGELAQITGWIAADAGQKREAARIYRIGISAAREAGDRTLAGHIAATLAYQYANTPGRESEGVALARAALGEAGEAAHPRARALTLDRLAWACTKTNDVQGTLRALGAAAETFATDTGDHPAPAYLYWVSADELRIMESRCHTELRRPLRAVPLLREVLGGYDATHTRELALYLSWLAVALADANEPEESAAVAERVIDLSADIASERTASRVRVILDRLTHYADVPEVASLLAEHPAA